MIIRRFRKWLKEIWSWLGEGKIIFLCLLVISAIIALGVFTWRSEFSIRFSGYVLQLIGMIFAIRGLLSIRAHFGQPLLRRMFFEWLKQFPKWKRDTVIGAAASMTAVSGMKARAEVWTADNAGYPVEKRIEGIVQNLEKIRVELRQHASTIDKLIDDYEKHKKLLIEQTQQLEKNIRSELESLHTSDLITSLVGLVWLTVGITMSTLSPEIYQWLV